MRLKISRSEALGPLGESFEEREHLRAQVLWLGDFKVEDTIRSAPDAPHRENSRRSLGIWIRSEIR